MAEDRMDFRLTDEQRELQAAAREFARAELPDVARQLERDNRPPSRDLVHRYAEMGFLGVNVPAELGGLGLDGDEQRPPLLRRDPRRGPRESSRASDRRLL